VVVARGHLTTHVWRPASVSQHRDGDRQTRVSVRDKRQSGVGIAFGVGDQVECRRGRRAEGRASGDRQSEIQRVTSGCNLDLVSLRIRLQISKIEASYITIHKVYFIF